jgi:DNA-binding HxlR family transcriptional regulator
MDNQSGLNTALNIIGNKWKLQILFQLKNSRLRFSELKKQLPLITHKSLIQELRNLMLAGLVEREMYTQIPPRVDYYLTSLGNISIPVVESLSSWGNYYATCHATNTNYTPLPIELAGYVQ